MSVNREPLVREPPPPDYAPFYVEHPTYTLYGICALTFTTGMVLALESGLCGNFDTEPGSKARRIEAVCVVGSSLGIPAFFTCIGAKIMNVARKKFAAQYGVDASYFVIDSGGD